MRAGNLQRRHAGVMHGRNAAADDGAAEGNATASRAADTAMLNPTKVTEIAKISDRIVTGML